MGKLYELTDENKALVMNLAETAGLTGLMKIKAFGIKKQKTPVSVSKANPTTEYLANIDVCIYLNEDAIDRLDEHCKTMLINDALSLIEFDSEKEKIVINKPELCISRWGRMKYGEDLLNAYESAILAQKQIDDEEREKKQAKNGGKQ